MSFGYFIRNDFLVYCFYYLFLVVFLGFWFVDNLGYGGTIVGLFFLLFIVIESFK